VGRGGGLQVSAIVSCSEDPSLNHAGYLMFRFTVLRKDKNKWKRGRRGWPY